MSRFRIVVLASGRGSNLQALLDAQRDQHCAFEVAAVVSDRPKSPALARALHAGVPAIAIKPADHSDREAFGAALCAAIDAAHPQLVVCAGYLRILSDRTVQRYAGRIINIHPSLLPRFPGLHTHAQALAAGDVEHGASVQYVIPALDAGPVIAQVRVPVMAGDSTQSLAERVLAREHPLLLSCVRLIAEGRVFQRGSDVYLDSCRLSRPLQLSDHDDLQPMEH